MANKESEIFAQLVKKLKPRLTPLEWEFLLERGDLYTKQIIKIIREKANKIREEKANVVKRTGRKK